MLTSHALASCDGSTTRAWTSAPGKASDEEDEETDVSSFALVGNTSDSGKIGDVDYGGTRLTRTSVHGRWA